ncbi:ATP synthase F1, delta subunit [Rickettsia felis str. Pedreira]|uniref:ATP synthase subunit delta n=2 Tax=Rickettsia felis TaxID=42862 RepID=ATPD_RICFE|nr:ATP synthase F1 subunit delta [Rickettsia felis]Q4UK15.1 RecName: Full=ATP synthase subunit delta; AltName: Full=ATP synthase F(1) sector subunit delta; AltName: Full=F-type ATPase subunit delta; Short=F-ATPase subunit delta [Rickettsia felis URRWXCal2]AAY62120.1 ATP synthase delta chain [Rickettsia felis URRWXCal2]KHO02302.1 ATP synthase F0F1 subunit delta [Rickettsia felis str. LSU]KHO02654.1 ATP synthase F0F1 subunit delta [Rickettsia felis]KJV58709.1 ATP synthase F1, delta subunit [Rick
MNKDNLIENYAVALFNNAMVDNIQDKIFEEITAINRIIIDNFDIREFLFSPIVNKDDKINVVNSLVKNTKFNKIVNNFLLLLVKNSRTAILSNIVDAYNTLLYESKNIKIVQVISANKLQPKEQEWIKSRIEKELNQKTEILFDIDSTIIGGIIIKYDSMLQDYSIKGSLDKITKALKKVRIAA